MPTVLMPLANGFEVIDAVTLIDQLRGCYDGNFDMMSLPSVLLGAIYLVEDPRIHAFLK